MAGAAVLEDGSTNPFSFKSFIKREGIPGSTGSERKGGKSVKKGPSKKKTGNKRTQSGGLHIEGIVCSS